MSSDRVFSAALAKGIIAEDKVYTYLRMNYSYVQDMRYQTHEKGSGPRLEGTSGSVILPDFQVIDRFKGRFLIDVKSKTSTYTLGNAEYFTVDDYKLEDYERCVKYLLSDKLMIVFVFKGNMYFYESTERLPKPVTFDNDYGKKAYLFEVDSTKIRS